MTGPFIFCLMLLTVQLNAAETEEYTWWVDPCTPALARATACQTGDEDLARWALEAWQRESGGGLVFRKSPAPEHARIRVHWAGGASSLYGETEPAVVDGKRGANIYVLPDIRALGDDIANAGRSDALFRDAIVYLTCLHESGHALGLAHTRNFADIMYSFGYGGDIVAYFQRYRRLLHTRADIPAHPGTSSADNATLRSLLQIR